MRLLLLLLLLNLMHRAHRHDACIAALVAYLALALLHANTEAKTHTKLEHGLHLAAADAARTALLADHRHRAAERLLHRRKQLALVHRSRARWHRHAPTLMVHPRRWAPSSREHVRTICIEHVLIAHVFP